MIFEILFCLTLTLGAVLWYLVTYARQFYGQLEDCGIPVIEPTLFLGSSPDSHAIVHHLEDVRRFKKYGPIWSLYEGRVPYVYVADPELIRLIFVKDFDHFHNRREVDFGTDTLNEILDFLPGEKWKTVRSMLSPLFTTSKLKAQAEVIATVCTEFMHDLKSECKGDGKLKLDVKLRVSAFLIDMFARSTLGIQMENAKDPHNKFATSFREMMGENMEYGFMHTLTEIFPFLTVLAPTFDAAPTKYIDSTIRSILKSRRETGVKKTADFVDFLNELWAKLDDPEFKRLGISETTIIAQAVNFFLGGYETTTTTLSHLLYYLADRPEVQAKIQTELDEIHRKGKFDMNSVADEHLPYTLACINEALRLHHRSFDPSESARKTGIMKG